MLGNVGPNLEAVRYRVDSGAVRLAFEFRNEPSEDDLEDADVTLTEVLADMAEHIVVDSTCLRTEAEKDWAGHRSVFRTRY